MKAHPSDLESLASKTRNTGVEAREAPIAMAFLTMCKELEPSLSFKTNDSRRDWLKNVAEIEFRVNMWQRRSNYDPNEARIPQDAFMNTVAIAKECWIEGISGEIRKLKFFNDVELQMIAERDLASLRVARMAGLNKGTLLLAGCVIETILIDLIERDQASSISAANRLQSLRIARGELKWKGFKPADVDRWTLEQMTAVSGPDGLGILSARAEDIATTMRTWRNFIHPRLEKEETTNRPLQPVEAAIAEALIELLISDIEASPKIPAPPP